MSILKSASLILINTARHSVPNHQNHSFYDLLMLKRTPSSQSFASKMVFPGGTLDQSDYSDKWVDIINRHRPLDRINRLICQNKLMIYRQSESLSSVLQPELFYRICAIRETFEETGILLAVDDSNRSVLGEDNRAVLDDIRRNKWQQRVSVDGQTFIDLFKSYDLLPDVAGLHEWAEWLTPPFIDRRFHTAFYVSAVHDSLPSTSLNETESLSLSWTTPATALDHYLHTRSLAPPQISELFELKTLYPDWKALEIELEKRGRIGGLKNITVRIVLSDGVLFVLPGDCRYPVVDAGEDYKGSQVIERKDLRVEDLERDERQRRCFVKDGQFRYKYNLNQTIDQ